MRGGRDALSVCIEELRRIVHAPGFTHVFSFILINESLFFSREKLRERNRFELISFHETSLIISLLSEKVLDDTSLSDSEVSSLYSECKIQLDKIHRALGAYSLPRDITRLFVDPYTFIEPIFYCASAAFWFDYLELAPRLYELDREFLGSRGFDVEACCRVIRSLSETQQRRMPGYLRESRKNYLAKRPYSSPLSQFLYEKEELPSLRDEDFESFARWMTLQPGTGPRVIEPIAFHPAKARPALLLSSRLVFVPNIAMLCEQVFESPYYEIARDKTYFSVNANNRATMSELILFDELYRAGADAVSRDVKLVSGETVVAQIDALITFGELAVLFEIKTKRLTQAAKNGDEESLIDDLRKGIIEAKNQLVSSRRRLLSGEFDTVTCACGADRLIARLRDVKHAICVSVMAHEFPAYPLLVRTIMKQEDVIDILAVSIFDIRLMTTYLNNAFDLVYYLHIRSQLGEALIYETEAALLAYHLRSRLTLPERVDAVFVDEAYSQEIDADYPARRQGENGLQLRFGIKNIDNIIDQLISFVDPVFFRTFSMLRGMAGSAAKEMNSLLIKARSKLYADGKAHDGTLGFGRSSLTFILAPSKEAAMERLTLLRAKRASEDRFDEEHFLILSARPRKRLVSARKVPSEKESRFQLRGAAFYKGKNASSGVTVFPPRVPDANWTG